ncbi:LysR family transcriptional regulator [Streptosporangium sp. NPDC000095]|uniref:LysR family transcriptional regulator n=1 Tax=Streptosporangium sp. NPDC000095 TaxID=3366184 RepID=UPI003683C127
MAIALHQSPSSISQQLSILEREARTPLLRKAGRRVQLTSQAELSPRRPLISSSRRWLPRTWSSTSIPTVCSPAGPTSPEERDGSRTSRDGLCL